MLFKNIPPDFVPYKRTAYTALAAFISPKAVSPAAPPAHIAVAWPLGLVPNATVPRAIIRPFSLVILASGLGAADEAADPL